MRKVLITFAILAVAVVAALLFMPKCNVYMDCCDECVSECVTPQCKNELGTYTCTSRCRNTCANSCSERFE
jgi:hypothetical protein